MDGNRINYGSFGLAPNFQGTLRNQDKNKALRVPVPRGMSGHGAEKLKV